MNPTTHPITRYYYQRLMITHSSLERAAIMALLFLVEN